MKLQVVQEDQPSDLLYNAFGIPALKNTPGGFSNLTDGFVKASTAFNSTSKLKVSFSMQSFRIGCIFRWLMVDKIFASCLSMVCTLGQMIMVLTDGNFAKNGFGNDVTLQQMVTSLSVDGVIVFIFSLGDDPNNMSVPDPLQELRSLSCQMNSTVTHVSVLDAQRNPLWGIRPYFDYQAMLRYAANSTFWTEIYDDFDGLGLVATVTYPG